MKKNTVLNVFMNGIPVGKWTFVNGNIHQFTYEDSWLSWSERRPISLSIPLDAPNATVRGAIVENFFDNLLPDNIDIRRRMQRKFSCASVSAFDLLAETGRDCVGAMQIVPEGTEVPSVKEIKSRLLNEENVAEILRSASDVPVVGAVSDDSFRISIAGAQEKTALLFRNQKWYVPLGSTPTTHILKLPLGYISAGSIDMRNSVQNEWLCLKLLQAFGLETAQVEVLSFDEIEILSVERFDRKLSPDGSWIMRLPQEDFCQATGHPGASKYENEGGPGIYDIMNLLLSSEHPETDRKNFFKAQILFWLLAAPDGHAKNFSIFLEREGRFRMTPLYDVMSVYPILGHGAGMLPAEKLKMAMAVTGTNRHYKWAKMNGRLWRQTANFCGAEKQVEKIINEILDSIEPAIEAVKKQIPSNFSQPLANSIFEGIRATSDLLAIN